MELKNRSFQHGKVALAVRTQYRQLQYDQSGRHLHRHLLVSRANHTFSAAAGLPVCRPCSVTLPQKSVQCWTRPVLVRKFLQQLSSTVTLIYSALKLWQYSVLFSKNHCFLRQPNVSQKCNQHYVIIRNTSCCKYTNRYFPYWKILFLSSIFLKAVAQKPCSGFCWNLQHLCQKGDN